MHFIIDKIEGALQLSKPRVACHRGRLVLAACVCLTSMMATATGNRLWLEDVEVHVYSRAALVTARWLFERAGSDEPPGSGPVTFVLVLDQDTTARIAYAHFANDPATEGA